MNEKKDLFEKVPVPKALLTFALPTVISQLINLIYNLADTFYVGRTGNPYMIASVSLAFTLFVMTVSIANLFGIGGGGMISRLMGKGENERAKKVSAFSFYGSLIAAAAYSLIVGLFMVPILKLFGASENTMKYSMQYTWIVVVAGTIPVVLSQTMAHFLRNTGYSKQASIGLSAGGILNMILDPLFMFVILPPGMEVIGAATATLLSNIIAMLYFFFMIRKVSAVTPITLSIKECRSIAGEDRKEVISVGIPSAILPGLYDLSNIFLNAKMAVHGDIQLAAIGIVLKVERLPNAIGLGISQGMLPLVAYNFAAKNKKRMQDAINTARWSGIIIIVFTVLLYELFAEQIVSAFISTTSGPSAESLAVIGFATMFLKIRSLASIPMFLNYHTSYCLQAMGDGKGTLIHSVARQLVFYIPIMFLFDALFAEKGIAWSLLVGEILGAITALVLLERWLKKKFPEDY
ncbi:MAG: cation transporter [Lachnospiraceae bacterium]|nr:cation transporter [Candidatus Darwinimomas equi]